MKTKEEAAQEYAEQADSNENYEMWCWIFDLQPSQAIINLSGEGFYAGAEFVNRWYKTNETAPPPPPNQVLCKTNNALWVGEIQSNGTSLCGCDWLNVDEWKPIDHPNSVLQFNN